MPGTRPVREAGLAVAVGGATLLSALSAACSRTAAWAIEIDHVISVPPDAPTCSPSDNTWPGLPARQRAKLQGISRPRSRQILAGAMVARATMKALNVNSVDMCPWALREEIVLHYPQPTPSHSTCPCARSPAPPASTTGQAREATAQSP